MNYHYGVSCEGSRVGRCVFGNAVDLGLGDEFEEDGDVVVDAIRGEFGDAGENFGDEVFGELGLEGVAFHVVVETGGGDFELVESVGKMLGE